MKVTIPQIRIIPDEDDGGFMRGQRDISFDIPTSEPFGTSRDGIDNEWLSRQAAYFMKLDSEDLYTVTSFTNRSHQWATMFIRTGKLPGHRELKMLVGNTQLAPLYFQITKLFDRGVNVYGKKGLDKEMFQDAEHRQYVRDLFQDKRSPMRYKAYQMLLRGNDFSDKTLKMALIMYNKDLKRIFASAPPLSKDIIVFRGVTTNTISSDKTLTTKVPTSTSFVMEYAGMYMEGKNTGRVQRITIKKGTRPLALCIVNSWLDAGEYEILLPSGKFKVVEKGVVRKIKGKDITTNDMIFLR